MIYASMIATLNITNSSISGDKVLSKSLLDSYYGFEENYPY